jgi:threonine aldolase
MGAAAASVGAYSRDCPTWVNCADFLWLMIHQCSSRALLAMMGNLLFFSRKFISRAHSNVA